MATAIAPKDLIIQFESFVDDSLDETTEYFLLNEVKDTLETGEQWQFLSAVDETQSVDASDTYLTAKTLPTDFGTVDPVGIYVGTDIVPYRRIPFNQRERYKNISRRYYIDFANNQYFLCGGNNPAGTIHFFYHKTSPTLAKATNVAWIFPARFHPILPYLMAKKFFAVDQPDKSRSWDDRWDTFAQEIMQNMRSWNAELIREAAANLSLGSDFSTYPNIADIDGDGSAGIYG